MAKTIEVLVVFAVRPGVEEAVQVTLPEGASVADAIDASGLRLRYSTLHLESARTGIWGRLVPKTSPVRSQDRVEIYRALTVDPKVARARRAGKKTRSDRD